LSWIHKQINHCNKYWLNEQFIILFDQTINSCFNRVIELKLEMSILLEFVNKNVFFFIILTIKLNSWSTDPFKLNVILKEKIKYQLSWIHKQINHCNKYWLNEQFIILFDQTINTRCHTTRLILSPFLFVFKYCLINYCFRVRHLFTEQQWLAKQS
jgi:hypothetical protein